MANNEKVRNVRLVLGCVDLGETEIVEKDGQDGVTVIKLPDIIEDDFRKMKLDYSYITTPPRVSVMQAIAKRTELVETVAGFKTTIAQLRDGVHSNVKYVLDNALRAAESDLKELEEKLRKTDLC